MGSLVQGRWARSLPGLLPRQRTVTEGAQATGRWSGRDPRALGAALVGAWALPVITHLLRADALLIVVIVYVTGGLIRTGSTVLDRLMITLGLLIGTAIAAGVLFSFWPFGLEPVAVGGTALTVLLAIAAVSRRRPRWPRRVLGSDVPLLAAMGIASAVAYGPLWNASAGHRLAFAALTGDRVRHFSLFDSIHRLGGYTYLMQGKARNVVDPGMLAVYPPGQHFTYALLDIFVTSRTDPGSPTAELMRYEVYTCLGYGFFVLCVAWGARWVAGPALAGWRRTFLVAAIASFLSTGVMTTSVWCGWDPQIFGMGLLALITACALRPPSSGRLHIVLMAALTIAIFLTYELFAPFAALIIVVSAVMYRRRWLPHWRLAVGAAIVTIPVSLSELLSAKQGGLSSSQAALALGFTVPMTKQSLAIIAALSIVGFAARAARRRPTAVAALASSVTCGAAVVAFWAYQHATIHTTSYYFEKAVQAWVIVALVGVGTAGHLLRRPKLPSRGVIGAALGCVAIVAGFVATDSFTYGPIKFSYAKMKPGPHTVWARVWGSGHFIFPSNRDAMSTLLARGLLGDGVPTLTVWQDHTLENINLSLIMAALNHDDGLISPQIYQLDAAPHLGVTADAGWGAQQDDSVTTLEGLLAKSATPLRVIVGNATLAGKLEQWKAQHPGGGLKDVLLIPNLGND
ncbi:hypothetical protein KGA66_05395 [Actinocrinis puniceicyclus]|uniref:Uncharacterized protein n=1 Tax=Actinocrinis puniceicyclus TaxID=977794 RepID=A0A8J8BBH1_9ACTN|nr:hypothetical protein [Actinocrinis puniceicyclus]MBS2962470.1 hypothetical protein [Actinocrinis puniceicyclus]